MSGGKSMLKIYGRTTSFNVQKVLWLAEELSLKYKHIELGGKFGGLDSAEFARLNPIKKVPVLVDGEHSIWESHTILRYLAAKYGDTAWYPPSFYERSLYERWMDWSQTLFQPAFMGVFWGYYRMVPKKRDMSTVKRSLEKCSSCLEVVNHQLSTRPFLAGDSLTLADITVGAILYRLTEQGLDVPLPEITNNWYQGLKLRRGYQQWVMSDFSELKGREDF
jgi:glutathione S-transferase